MDSKVKTQLDEMVKLIGKQNAWIAALSEQVGSLTKGMADQQAELSKLQARLGKTEADAKHHGSMFLKSMEALAKMKERLDATVLRLEMCEASADAQNNAGEARH